MKFCESSSVIPKVCSADHWWSAIPYKNQYFELCGALKCRKWSVLQKTLWTTDLAPRVVNDDKVGQCWSSYKCWIVISFSLKFLYVWRMSLMTQQLCLRLIFFILTSHNFVFVYKVCVLGIITSTKRSLNCPIIKIKGNCSSISVMLQKKCKNLSLNLIFLK